MDYEFDFRHRHFVVKEGDNCVVVSIYDKRKHDELVSKRRFPRAESALLLDLVKSRGKPIEAPANTATNLRRLLGDNHVELVENVRREGYKLAVTARAVREHLAVSERIHLDPVRARLPMWFLSQRSTDSMPLVLDEVIVLRHDRKSFVRGYSGDLDPQSLAYLGGRESTEIYDWLGVSISETTLAESLARDGYVMRRTDQKPLLFMGRSGRAAKLTWESRSQGASRRSPRNPSADPDVWWFRAGEHEWTVDGEACRTSATSGGFQSWSYRATQERSAPLAPLLRNPAHGNPRRPPHRDSVAGFEAEKIPRLNALQKHLGSLARKLEPGVGLEDSTLILNQTRRDQDSTIARSPSTFYPPQEFLWWRLDSDERQPNSPANPSNRTSQESLQSTRVVGVNRFSGDCGPQARRRP